MKAIIVLAALLLASCAPYYLNPIGYEVKNEPLESAWQMVAACFYQDDKAGYWKSPREFFRDGGGDCEDFAAALVYLLGPESAFVVVQGTSAGHAMVYFHGRYVEPQVYGLERKATELTILHVFTYNEVMKYVTNLGRKDITAIGRWK